MKIQELIRLAACRFAAVALLSTAQATDPLLTNTTSFRIPFAIESSGNQPVAGSAILFASVGDGALEQVQRVDAAAGGFEFVAPADGHYAFAVRMTDASGQLAGNAGPLAPELEVIVDTAPPELNIQLFETTPGNVRVSWTTDSQIAPGSLRLEYAEGADGRWQLIPDATEASGQATVQTQSGTSVSIRGFATDLAANQGSGTGQIVTAAPPLSIPGQTATASPAPTTNLTNSEVAGTKSTSVLGPNPFSAPAAMNSRPVSTAAPVYSASPQPPITTGINPITTGVPAGTPYTPAQVYPGTAAVSTPVSSDFQNPAAVQLVNSRVFNIAYQVEDVGPSGVSVVELFVTENSGQEWFRYGKDIDLKTPFQVDTRGEGTFGFAVRVVNGIGFSDPPPQPGDAPAIVVTVDQTPPQIRFGAPQVSTGGQGRILLNWQVADQNPAPSPVRLEYATGPSGPWTPLFDWQMDQRGYEMPIQTGLPNALYFRLLARDAAGNVATAQTPQALLVDQQRPRARLLRVEPSSSRSY